MIVHMADIATNGELMAQSVLDTDTVKSPLNFAFRQLVETEGARLSLRGPASECEIDLLWLRHGDEASATFLVNGRRALSLMIVTSAYDPKELPAHLHVLQQSIVQDLHGTRHEPAFHLRDIAIRPLAVLTGWWSPDATIAKRLRRLARVVIAMFAELDSVKAAVAALEVD